VDFSVVVLCAFLRASRRQPHTHTHTDDISISLIDHCPRYALGFSKSAASSLSLICLVNNKYKKQKNKQNNNGLGRS
jgi:hypothetical protein